VGFRGTNRPLCASNPVMLAMSVPGVLGLVVLTVLLVGFIAWLLPRPEDRRSSG
jgi:hypothetical protein